MVLAIPFTPVELSLRQRVTGDQRTTAVSGSVRASESPRLERPHPHQPMDTFCTVDPAVAAPFMALSRTRLNLSFQSKEP